MRNKRRWARLFAGALAMTLIAGSPVYVMATSSDNSTTQEGPGEPPTGTPPEKPDGEAPSGEAPTGTPPEKPDGEAPSGEAPTGTPPEKPDGEAASGEAPTGTPPEKPDGEAPSGEGQPGEMPAGGGANTQTFDYKGTYAGTLVADNEEVTSDGESISATDADVNAALAQNGGVLTITNGRLEKTGSDENGDNCNFYGVNATLLSVGEGSMTYISDASLTSDATGSNAIFATDSGSVYANNVTISTSEDNSRGLDATYGGTIIANQVNIETKGDHCAAVATDRGGGNISVTNSNLNTGGNGSPILYSTGDIQVSNVTGQSNGSQIAGMEGLNTILIYHSTLESTITDKTASDPVANGVIIYQSTSGDAETSTGESATFQAANSTLTSAIESGSMFYVTNTKANILLSDTELLFDSDKANLLQIEGNDANGWGQAGSNGGTVVFTARGETLSGDISVDTISSLDLYLLDGSTYTGTMTITENAAGKETSTAPITVNIASDSTWVVTADTTVNVLNAEEGAQIVDAEGKVVSIVVNGTKQVEGDSALTLTVTDGYSSTVTTGSENELSEAYIDRAGFDAYYGTQTDFPTLSAASLQDVTADITEEPAESVTEESIKDNKVTYILIGIIAAGIAALAGLGLYVKRKK